MGKRPWKQELALRRKVMLRDHSLLHGLYSQSASENVHVIATAKRRPRRTLIRVLHYIARKDIPIRRAAFDELEKVNLSELLLERLGKLRDVAAFLRYKRKAQVQFLKKFARHYHGLLSALFEHNE